MPCWRGFCSRARRGGFAVRECPAAPLREHFEAGTGGDATLWRGLAELGGGPAWTQGRPVQRTPSATPRRNRGWGTETFDRFRKEMAAPRLDAYERIG